MRIHPHTPQARAFEGVTRRAAQRIRGENVTLGWREAVPVIVVTTVLAGSLLLAIWLR